MSAATDIQAIVGEELMQRICRKLGGMRIYIPHSPPIAERRNREIVKQFYSLRVSGQTAMSAYHTLSEQYDLSERWVQEIVLS